MGFVSPMRLCRIALLAAASLGCVSRAGAQPSAYIPLDDVVYSYIDVLFARGDLYRLPATERPYRVAEVLAALDDSGSTVRSRSVQAWRGALLRALRKWEWKAVDSLGGIPMRWVGAVRLSPQSTARRDLALSVPGAPTLEPGASIHTQSHVGPLVLAGRFTADRGWLRDPEWAFSREGSARMQEDYASLQFRYAQAFIGRMSQNWGPYPVRGLAVGELPYPFDQVGTRVGTSRLHFTSLLARLDDREVNNPAGPVQRYLASHRLATRLGGFEIALGEQALASGRARGLDAFLLNPVQIYILGLPSENLILNLAYTVDLTWRSRRGLFLGYQFLLDDAQHQDRGQRTREPQSIGMSYVAEGIPLLGEHRVFAAYSIVSNLTYRSLDPHEGFTFHRSVLGRGASDFDEARLGVDLSLVPGVVTRPYLLRRRQGEGDPWDPFPTFAQFDSVRTVLNGVVQHTSRAGVQLSATASRWLEVRGDVGFNIVRNAGHAPGETRRGFAGRLVGVVPAVTLDFLLRGDR